MAQKPDPEPSQTPTNQKYPIQPGTFQSLLPILDSLLSTIHDQATSPIPITQIEASESITVKARELGRVLEGMKGAAMALPGGAVSRNRIEELTRLLDDEAEKRRAILAAFGQRDMSMVERFAVGNATEEIEDDGRGAIPETV